MNSIKPTIYLIKGNVSEAKDIFKKGLRLQSKTEGDFTLFYTGSKPNIPDWANYVEDNFDVTTKPFKNSSSKAVIIVKVDDRLMAIPLGSGIHLMDMMKTEYNFGLRTALNCIPKGQIRQIDTTTPEINSQKTKKQAAIDSTPEEFGINKDKDILRGMTGKLPKDHILGESMDGKDSLRLGKNIQGLEKLKATCEQALKYHLSDEYKKDYAWIDNIALVRDKSLIAALTKLLAKKLKQAQFENMFFSPPVYYEMIFDYKGFVFSSGDGTHLNKKDSYEMPDMLDWKKSVGESRKELKEENIDSFKVNLMSTEDNKDRDWPLQRCLAWETELNHSKYILSEGSWYLVAPDFYTSVNKFYLERILDPHDLPTPTKSKIEESEYNNEICKKKGRLLFDLGHTDAKLRFIGTARNEVCDVYDTLTKTFIHVKMGKSSSTLSHLFRQGAFSGHILKLDEDMRREFVKHLVDLGQKADIIKEPYSPDEYKIIFALVIGKKQKKDIPFFSKVTFRDTVTNTLGLIGYKCELAYVVAP